MLKDGDDLPMWLTMIRNSNILTLPTWILTRGVVLMQFLLRYDDDVIQVLDPIN